MADTLQAVRWSIERPCQFRHGPNWPLPRETSAQFAVAMTIARAEVDQRIVDGICVFDYTNGEDHSGRWHKLPVSGFRVEDQIGPVGSIEAVRRTCSPCDANIPNDNGVGFAGCFGSFYVDPDSSELEERLLTAIREHHLEHRLRSAFPVTTPLWYGLWMNSPLERLQAELLQELLKLALDPKSAMDESVVHFLNALQAVVDWNRRLHVSLSPPGHEDMGCYREFPHCSHCKAGAPVGPWLSEYPRDLWKCRVCLNEYLLNQKWRFVKTDRDADKYLLSKQLGEQGFVAFQKRFLQHRGGTLQPFEEIVDNWNQGPLLRRIDQVRLRRHATNQRVREQSPTRATAQELPGRLRFSLDDAVLECVLIPAGEFLMGSGVRVPPASEAPRHAVRIDEPFYLSQYPVTLGSGAH